MNQDAYDLTEAIGAEPDWFITQDKDHFLKANAGSSPIMRIGTAGDLIEALEDEFTFS
jgi:hypothetical protein